MEPSRKVDPFWGAALPAGFLGAGWKNKGVVWRDRVRVLGRGRIAGVRPSTLVQRRQVEDMAIGLRFWLSVPAPINKKVAHLQLLDDAILLTCAP